MGFGTLKNKAKNFLGQYEQKDPASFAAAQQAIGGLLILDGFVGIDNPFQGKKRSGIFGTLIGIVIGIVFMVVPGFFGAITGTKAMTATTNAIVVAVTPEASSSPNSGGACTLTVRYSVAGKEYNQPSSMGSSDNCTLTAGQTVPISYNPQQPGAWAYNLKSTGTYFSLFFWAGLLVAIVSFVTFIIRLLSIIFGWKLLQRGRALAKTLPQGVSLGTMIEEIKQSFKGTLFNGGAAGVSFMQTQAQAPVATPSASATPSPVEEPVQQQISVSPVATSATSGFAAPNNDDLSVRPLQTIASVSPSAPPDPYAPETAEVEPPTVPAAQPQPVVQKSYPSSTPPAQPPFS
jgi:hypothetical protein